MITHTTFHLDRALNAPPARVFAAFADPAQKRRWFAEGGTGAKTFDGGDFRAGGIERSSFTVPQYGLCSNFTTYLEIRENERIVFAYSMSMNGTPFSASLASVEFVAEGGGTRLRFTEQAAFFENADGAEMRRHGWQQLFGKLDACLAA